MNHNDATMIVSPETLGRSLRTGELRTQRARDRRYKHEVRRARMERKRRRGWA